MKLSIDRGEFLEVLSKAKSATEKKTALPILNNFFLSAKDNTLTLKATDLENYLTFRLKARVEEEGSIALNASKLTSIVKGLTSVDVHILLRDGTVEIKGGRIQFKLTGVDPEDFPEFPEVVKSSTMPVYDFLKAIEKVEYAISKEDTRYALQGLYVHGVKDQTHFVGSDGHRLALYKSPFQTPYDLLIPRKSLKVLQSLFEGYIGDVDVGKDSAFAHFAGEDWTLSVRLLEGEYPDYLSVIPEEFNYNALVNREEMIDSIKRLSAIAESSAFPIKLTFSSNLLVLEISEPEYGEGRDEIDIEYSDEPIEIGFNGKYLLEALGGFDVERVYIRMVDPDSAVVIEPQHPENDTYVCLIMPMRL